MNPALAIVLMVLAAMVGAAVPVVVSRRQEQVPAPVPRAPAPQAVVSHPSVAAVAPADERRLRRLEGALEAITQGIVVVDAAGGHVFTNPFAASFVGGRHGDALVADAIDQLLATARRGHPEERELQLYGPPRRTLWLSARPILDGPTRIGAVVLIDDVTEAERIDAMRRDFVTNISHELRTPVGAISLLAETLADEPDPTVAAGLADRLQIEAARVGRTIEDLLELSRIEHGAPEASELVEIQAVAREVVDALRSAAEQRGVHLGLTLPAEPLHVDGDPRQLRSAVYNLVDNALKYTEAGAGVVSVRAWRSGDAIDLEVQDNGIGIPRRDLDRVFERFYRVDRARTRGSGGTGLGLAIVRHVVANHGGTVRIDSREGEGSTFTLELPAADAAAGSDSPAPNEVAT